MSLACRFLTHSCRRVRHASAHTYTHSHLQGTHNTRDVNVIHVNCMHPASVSFLSSFSFPLVFGISYRDVNSNRFFSALLLFFPFFRHPHHANGDNQLFCSQEKELSARFLPERIIAKVTRFASGASRSFRDGLLISRNVVPETKQLYTEL